ncbi:MAG TPA: hypothetical protein VGD78_13070 [Chthoniobacterales bacterium]
MSQEPLVKVKAESAAEVCAHFDLTRESRALLREAMPPRELIGAFLKNKHYLAAIDFMAHALPAREAIWWGCLCLQHACGDRLSQSEKAAGKAAVQWIFEPTEEKRVAAKTPAELAGPVSPAGALASAAHQAEDGPSGAAFASAKAVAGAVKLASSKVDAIKIVDTQRLFVELGIEVAKGRFGWPATRNKVPICK